MSAAYEERCVLCGQQAQNMHHVTGRILDMKFLAPLCLDCHKLIHDDWHSAGIGREDRPATFLEGSVQRLRRAGMFLGRLAAAGWGGTFIATGAVVVATWADRLHRNVAALDEYAPEWRTWPEVGE